MTTEPSPPLLEVDGLVVEARAPDGPRRVLDGLTFTLREGEALSLLGQADAGKSVAALALMRLLPDSTLRATEGTIRLAGQDLAELPEREMRHLRGGTIARLGPDPMAALDPRLSVGAQLAEAIRCHADGRRSLADIREQARQVLDLVHMPDPERRLQQYPSELPPAMRQWAALALALCNAPRVLIADEPVAALDLTFQDELLTLLLELRTRAGLGLLLLTRDREAAVRTDRVAVLRGGRIVEDGSPHDVFDTPRDPYTRAMLTIGPRLGTRAGTEGPPRLVDAPAIANAETVLRLRDLTVSEAPGRSPVRDVSFVVHAGETLGLIGESGAGTDTVAKAVLGLVPFTGEVEIDGTAIQGMSRRDMRPFGRTVQLLQADGAGALDPLWKVGAALTEPLAIHGIGSRSERREIVAALIRRVGLPPDVAARRPHELSPLQRQRIAIARALAPAPKLVVALEPTEGLDLSARAGVLEVLLQVQQALGIACLLVSRDPAVIELMSHQVAVMREGRIAEIGSRRAIFERARSVYVRDLLAPPGPVPEAAPAAG